MNFQDAIRTCYQKYAEFEGTAERPEFWWFFLYSAIGNLALMTLSFSLAALFSLANLLPWLAAAARRLRDTGHNPLLLLIMLVPLLGYIAVLVLLAMEGKAGAARVADAVSAN